MAFLFESILVDLACFLVACFVLLRLYKSHTFSYWKKRGVFYIEPMLFFGNMKDFALRKKHMSDILMKVYEENHNQPYVGLYSGNKPALMVRDLDLLRCIFVKDSQSFINRSDVGAKSTLNNSKSEQLFTRSLFMESGKRWRTLRVKMTPTFTSGKIKKMFYLINECGKQLLPCIEHETSRDGAIVVKDMIARYSTDVIASCAFGVNANALEDPNCEFRSTMRKMFEPGWKQKMAGIFRMLLPWLRRPLRLDFIDPSIYPFVNKTFWDVVNYRKQNKVVRDDFVDLLMQIKQYGQVRSGDASDQHEIERDSTHMGKMSKNDQLDVELDDDDILAQAFIFIIAGFETSSSVITQTLYELALHTDIQGKLRHEIKQVLEKHNNQVTYDAIAEMTYMDMVISETTRKYPTLPTLERYCVSDYKVQGTNLTIEKGTRILIPLRAIHYDPEIYPDPQTFDPERFSPENRRKRSNFAHLPFGEGPRNCIGMRFGQMQVKTALVHVITSYQVSPCKETPQPPLVLKPGGGVLTPRQDIVLTFTKIK